MPEFQHEFEVFKADDENRVVYGWASVIEENGNPIVDTQGDVIKEEDLLKAVHQFVINERVGKVMHAGEKVADLVESVVFSHDLQKALGVDLGRVGWLIGMKIQKDDLWARVKKGDFPAFSIGGLGDRVKAEGLAKAWPPKKDEEQQPPVPGSAKPPAPGSAKPPVPGAPPAPGSAKPPVPPAPGQNPQPTAEHFEHEAEIAVGTPVVLASELYGPRNGQPGTVISVNGDGMYRVQLQDGKVIGAYDIMIAPAGGEAPKEQPPFEEAEGEEEQEAPVENEDKKMFGKALDLFLGIMKGGPGSGRYPKGSGKNSFRENGNTNSAIPKMVSLSVRTKNGDEKFRLEDFGTKGYYSDILRSNPKEGLKEFSLSGGKDGPNNRVLNAANKWARAQGLEFVELNQEDVYVSILYRPKGSKFEREE